jgi:hypothetical protein
MAATDGPGGAIMGQRSTRWKHPSLPPHGVRFPFFVIYFTPSLIGFSKKKKNSGAIFALNLLVGWTVIGWLGAFIWSLTNS